MNNQANNDEEVLAELVRKAGDPRVSPDPHYVEKLRTTILDRVACAQSADDVTETTQEADVVSLIARKEIRSMKYVARIAVAASVLAAIGLFASWLVIGSGSTNIAFANVAEALDSLQSATFDVISEAKGEKDHPPAIARGKGFFLAPSHERIETSLDIGYEPAVKAAEAAARRTQATGSPAAKAAAAAAAESVAKAVASMPKNEITQIMIVDGEAGKCTILSPSMKSAMLMDLKKMRQNRRESMQPDLFEMVRRLVRDGSSGTGEKPQRLGKKEIDGREAVGFRIHVGDMDMTLWADPKTAYPIRIEAGAETMGDVHAVMNNFRYNVAVDPSLFSLEPPAGYSTQERDVTIPTEEDLIRTLRIIAEHNKEVFPAKLGMNQEVMAALMAGLEPKMDKTTQEKLEAATKAIEAKYGSREQLRAKYGTNIPSEIMAEIMKATMPIMQEHAQKQMPARQQEMQERQRGLTFYQTLKPENDPHYVGASVKLGTPNRPILWYEPTGAEKYRVIYADLSVKEMTSDDVTNLPEARAQ